MSLESSGNRLRFFHALGIDPERVWSLRQIHSRTVIDPGSAANLPSEKIVKEIPEADGFVVPRGEHILSVTVADCLPIFLADRRGRCFGAFHSGWKGTGIVIDGLHMMENRYGMEAADAEVFIGPSIGPCCYHVDEKRSREFLSAYGTGAVKGTSLDLPWVNRTILQEAGVPDEGIHVDGSCTSCDPRFSSFRRQGPDSFTRMLALIGYFQ